MEIVVDYKVLLMVLCMILCLFLYLYQHRINKNYKPDPNKNKIQNKD